MHRVPWAIAVLFFILPAQAWASYHSPLPVDGPLGLVLMEMDHFVIHLTIVAHALATMVTAPELGVALLDSQGACASYTPLSAVLFGTPIMAIVTFFGAVVAFGIATYLSLRWLTRLVWARVPYTRFGWSIA